MSYQIELRHYRYFLAVADELHFRKAAEKLYISQPGLSRQIRQMEDQLGIRLFERTNRRVNITPAGEYLASELRLLFQQLDGAIDHARLMHEGRKGSIRMGYVGSAMQEIIPDLLIRFGITHPHIRFRLKEMDNSQQLDALRRGDIDVGFVRLNQVPDELVLRPVKKETFSLVLPESHPLTSDTFQDLSQLKDHPFILFEKAYSPVYYARVMSIFEDCGFSPSVSHSTVHANTIFRLVQNGFGFSIVPSSLQLGYSLPVKFIELDKIPQRAILYILKRKENRNPPLQQLWRMMDAQGLFLD